MIAYRGIGQRKPAAPAGLPAADISVPLARQQSVVFNALAKAARAGQRCPSNNELCELLGCSSSSVPPKAIARLVEMGLVKLWRGQRSRIVEIVATGQRTAGDIGKITPHWTMRARA